MSIHENEPQPGHYKTRLVRNGPWLPARIWWQDGERDPETGELISDQVLYCQVGNDMRDPHEMWTWLAGQPIDEAEYQHMTASLRADPNSPAQRPYEPVDHMAVKPPF